jgi:hypothetical protein
MSSNWVWTSQLAVGVARGGHVHAHVHELGLVDADHRAVEAQVDDHGIGALAQFVERLDEGDAVGNMDLLGERTAEGIAQEGQEHLAVAAAGLAHIAGGVETEQEARADIEGRADFRVGAIIRGSRIGGAAKGDQRHGAQQEERDDGGKAERQCHGRAIIEGERQWNGQQHHGKAGGEVAQHRDLARIGRFSAAIRRQAAVDRAIENRFRPVSHVTQYLHAKIRETVRFREPDLRADALKEKIRQGLP